MDGVDSASGAATRCQAQCPDGQQLQVHLQKQLSLH